MIASLFFLCGVYFAHAHRYEGCYQITSDPTLSLDPMLSLDPTLSSPYLSYPVSPAKCIETCRSYYYMFMAQMNGEQCYCMNSYGQHGLSKNGCLPCNSDPNNYCGSHIAMSVYATGQLGPSPPRAIQVDRGGKDTLVVTWQPPDISNGNITSYNVRAVPIKTYTIDSVSTVEVEVLGDVANRTILRDLRSGTEYNVSIIAKNKKGSSDPAYAIAWTSIGPPEKPSMPEILERGSETITVKLSEGHSERGPINAYQVVVVQLGIIPPVGPNVKYLKYDKALEKGLNYYVTAEFDPSDFPRYQKFVVGDGKMIGGYYNIPLKSYFVSAQIGLVVISRVRMEEQYAYSDLANMFNNESTGEINRRNKSGSENGSGDQMDSTALALCIAITILTILLAVSILLYFLLRRRHERFSMRKLPEQQELTLQGPVYEVDNVGYIPEDIPERVNHYQELKKKVWSIPRNALSVDNFIVRRGRFGTVHTGTVLKDDVSYPVTIHTIADGTLKGSDKRHMLRELDVCIRAGTMKYLAGLVGTCETLDTLYVALELPPQILKNRLLGARSGDVFPVDRILPITSSIAFALQYLASLNVVHGHLCARNVGLLYDWTPKLMGHGIAKYALEDIKYARWTAVECFDNRKKQQQDVVWAFGVFLWELFSMGGTPYSNLTLDSEVEDAVTRGVRLPQLLDIPDPIYEVMLSCWRNDLEERPTFDELARMDTLSICPITAITEPYIPELELN